MRGCGRKIGCKAIMTTALGKMPYLTIRLPREGCGALNLVNVAEPLKIARIIAGVSMKNGSRMPHYTRHFTGCEIIK